jgi:hypothetical protein
VLLFRKLILPLSQHQRGTPHPTQAASKCRLNYSTAKILLRDLTPREKKYVKRLLIKKERDEKEGMSVIPQCSYKEIGSADNGKYQVEVISRIGFDFFDLPLKKQ